MLKERLDELYVDVAVLADGEHKALLSSRPWRKSAPCCWAALQWRESHSSAQVQTMCERKLIALEPSMAASVVGRDGSTGQVVVCSNMWSAVTSGLRKERKGKGRAVHAASGWMDGVGPLL